MKITSYDQLKEIIDKIQLNQGLAGRIDYMENYRGQSLDSYKLENGLARFGYTHSTLKKKELRLYNQYVKSARDGRLSQIQKPYLKQKYPFIKDWFYQYQAQHLGVKTRLMDWTIRWEIALLFAVSDEKYFGQDGQFWVFYCPRENVINSGNLEEIYGTHPLEIEGSYMINSPYYHDNKSGEYVGERRRLRQHGRFFTQSLDKAIIPLEEQEEFRPHLRKFIIDGNSKEKIKKELGAITLDWAYFKHVRSISNEVNRLNRIVMNKSCVYLYLEKEEWADAWINGGEIPINLASKYKDSVRDGVMTPDENLNRNLQNLDDEAFGQIAKINEQGIGKNSKININIGTFVSDGVLKGENIKYTARYEDAYILSFSYTRSKALMERLGKTVCVEIKNLDKIRRQISSQIGLKGMVRRCEYTEDGNRHSYLKSTEDAWQDEVRIIWEVGAWEEETRWVRIKGRNGRGVAFD